MDWKALAEKAREKAGKAQNLVQEFLDTSFPFGTCPEIKADRPHRHSCLPDPHS